MLWGLRVTISLFFKILLEGLDLSAVGLLGSIPLITILNVITRGSETISLFLFPVLEKGSQRTIDCRERLGGLLKFYHRQAS